MMRVDLSFHQDSSAMPILLKFDHNPRHSITLILLKLTTTVLSEPKWPKFWWGLIFTAVLVSYVAVVAIKHRQQPWMMQMHHTVMFAL